MFDDYDFSFIKDLLVSVFPADYVNLYFDSFIDLHALWVLYEFQYCDAQSHKILFAKFRRHCYDHL